MRLRLCRGIPAPAFRPSNTVFTTNRPTLVKGVALVFHVWIHVVGVEPTTNSTRGIARALDHPEASGDILVKP